MATLGERIKELIATQNVSHQEFCDIVNERVPDIGAKLSRSLVVDLIQGSGRQPGYLTIVKIAKAFNISTDYLIGLSDKLASANDDINAASDVTNLSTDIIEDLITIREYMHSSSPNHEDDYVYSALYLIINEYARYVRLRNENCPTTSFDECLLKQKPILQHMALIFGTWLERENILSTTLTLPDETEIEIDARTLFQKYANELLIRINGLFDFQAFENPKPKRRRKSKEGKSDGKHRKKR